MSFSVGGDIGITAGGGAGVPGPPGPPGLQGPGGLQGPPGFDIEEFDEPIMVPGPPGPSFTYNNATPMPSTVGGWETGSTFSNDTLQQLWDGLLYPYQYPSFTSFVMVGVSSPVEVGDTISGIKTFTWADSNPTNVQVNSVAIRDTTGAVDLAVGLVDDGTENVNIGVVQKITATTNVWTIRATNTKVQVFSKTLTVAWEWMFYYGESINAGPLIEADIKALRIGVLKAAIASTYSYLAGGYKYLCYPSVLGTATLFKDSLTLLNVPFETVYTVSVTNVNGITTNYNVHRSTNILGSAIDIIVS